MISGHLAIGTALLIGLSIGHSIGCSKGGGSGKKETRPIPVVEEKKGHAALQSLLNEKVLHLLDEGEVVGLTSEDLDRPFAELEEGITKDGENLRKVVQENPYWQGVLEELFNYELIFHASFSKWKEEEVPLHEITPRKMLIQNDMDLDLVDYPTRKARVEKFVADKLSALEEDLDKTVLATLRSLQKYYLNMRCV